jgi:hypothetical protein
MKRISVMLFLILSLPTSYSHALDLPESALQLLAEASADPCSICARQEKEKAFAIMNTVFVPGQVINSDDSCQLLKGESGDENEISLTCYPSAVLLKSLKEGEKLPQIVFRFYTPGKRLVGISDKDYTDKTTADLFRSSRPGTVYKGRIKLIPYKYGDGPAYNYFPQTNKLLVHCVVLQLEPMRR